MAKGAPDDVAHLFAAVGRHDQIVAAIDRRFGGLVDALTLRGPGAGEVPQFRACGLTTGSRGLWASEFPCRQGRNAFQPTTIVSLESKTTRYQDIDAVWPSPPAAEFLAIGRGLAAEFNGTVSALPFNIGSH
jgi:hypothetical protein